jgi:polar amino acid transport system substrate-binding protein
MAVFLGAIAAAATWSGGRAGAASLLDKVRQSGTILIGTSNDAPLSYLAPQDKSPVGVLPDVLREFFAREGLTVRIQMEAMPFASLIPAVQSGRIDLMGDAMYVRPARQQVMDFTDVVFFNPESLDVPKGNPLRLHALTDLCGHSAGTYEGTVYVDMLKKTAVACPADHPLTIRQYPTIQSAFADLAAGRLDAAIVDSTLSAYAIKQNPALNFELVADYVPEDKKDTGCAFAVMKGDAGFVAAFNKQYAAMLADGTAANLFAKWGLTPTDFFLKP